MYQSFEAVIKKGKITPLENIALKESSRVLITVLDEKESVDWKQLKSWMTQQRKSKKYISCTSLQEAKAHLQKLAQR